MVYVNWERFYSKTLKNLPGYHYNYEAKISLVDHIQKLHGGMVFFVNMVSKTANFVHFQ